MDSEVNIAFGKFSTQCIHCAHIFELDNLKKDRRRKVKKNSEIDVLKALADCFHINENQLSQFVEKQGDVFLCSQCYNTLKAVDVCLKKVRTLKDTLTVKTSNDFKNVIAKFDNNNKAETGDDVESDTDGDISTDRSSVKRRRECLTPSKSGCTPRGKRNYPKEPYTPKHNRRRLNFVTPTCLRNKSPAVTSPGPRVKVQIGFHGSGRTTHLKGSSKLACRAIVMKQHKTALKHVLNLGDNKKELIKAIKKTLAHEVNEICAEKDSVFRGTNISKFSWNAAFMEVKENCPVILELLKTVIGKSEKIIPRLVTSLSVLLFTKNHKMNSLQAMNSLMMYRGHVRTKVYSSFNRAGLCKSYKTTILTVDNICQNVDLPVKKWQGNVAKNNNIQKRITVAETSAGDHNYATLCIDSSDQDQDISISFNASTNDLSSILCTPGSKFPLHVDEFQTPRVFIQQGYHSNSSDTSFIGTSTSTPISFRCNNDIYKPEHGVHAVTENSFTIPVTPSLTTSNNDYHCVTPGTRQNYESMESPLFTSPADVCNDADGCFQIIMDNLNLVQKTRHKTMDTSNKVHNLTHSIAVKDKVTADHLDNTHPQADILTIPNSAFLPDENDLKALKSDFQILIQRTLVEFIPAFQSYKDIVVFHIQHKYSEESEKKSKVVPLGILQKDENITEQMIEIMEHLQQYVPQTHKMISVLLAGDALSVERGMSAQKARADGLTEEDRLNGLIWKSEDWHAHIIALQDVFNTHYKGTSSGEKGTLFQLRNYFDRRGVKLEVKDSVNDCREFLRFVTKGYIILAALQILNVESVDSVTQEHNSEEEQRSFLDHLSSRIVDEFISVELFKLKDTLDRNNRTNDKRRFTCGFPGCPKSFALDGHCRAKHRRTCLYKEVSEHTQEYNVLPGEDRHVNVCSSIPYTSTDFKYNYSCSLLKDGLLDWCREDAAKENDGDRLVRLWKFDMLRFHQNRHTKYRLLAFHLQAQLLATLIPRQAHQLKYNRGINVHGGKGCNVPGDLGLEFMNMRAKDALSSLHGNLTPASIRRCGRSLQGCNDILDSYTNGLHQYFGKPSNTKPSIQKDIKRLVQQLLPEKLFEKILNRYHRSFPNIKFDVCENMDTAKLNDWLTSKKEDYARTQRLRSYIP